MTSRAFLSSLATVLLFFGASVATPPPSSLPTIAQATLTAPGGQPFHLKAVITERGDPDSRTEVEIFWMAPDKWRRTIQSKTEFSQTLIVNGDQVFEQDSDDYFPLWSRSLVMAMVNPKLVLDAVRPGDRLLTKANGASDESGRVCFSGSRMCGSGQFGLQESIGAPGHSVDFMNYKNFHGKRVARLLIYHVDPGDSYKAEVTELGDLKQADPTLFAISTATPMAQQIRVLPLPEAELRSLALQPVEVIWPQVLDGATSGRTSYFLSVGRSGTVEEVLPLSVMAERADDVARRQIKKWKFKPELEGGVAVQTEGVLNFDFNTRAYGPAEPLKDEEVRKLATNVVEPTFPTGLAPGSSHVFWVAIDEEGNVIETISGEGPPELSSPGMKAIGQWRFGRMVVDGKSVPYRAQIIFRVP